MISKNFEFRVAKCSNERRIAKGMKECNPDAEAMDKYVRDIQVDPWAIYEKVNFAIRHGKPTFRVMDLLGTYLYDDKIAIQKNFYLSKNIIKTKDDIFYLGQYTYIGYFYSIGNMVDRPLLK